MIDKAARSVFVFAVLVMGGALEELLPKCLGVGFPVLLASTLFFSSGRSLTTALVFTLLAGWMEEALSGLPVATAISFFLAAAALGRWAHVSHLAMLAVFPAYELWLAVWIPDLQGGVFARLLLAIPFGLVTSFAVAAVMSLAERKAAVNG